MARMPSYREGEGVLIGPCPGCQMWQVQYELVLAPYEELLELVEDALQEHLDECLGLQEIVATLRGRP